MKLNRNNVAFFFLAAAIAIPAFAQSVGPGIHNSKCLACIGMDLAATNIGKGKMPPDTSFGKNDKLAGGQVKSVLAYICTLPK